MSKEKKVPVIDVNQEPVPVASPPTPATPPVVPVMVPANPRLSDLDKMALDLARAKRQTALEAAKASLAQNENAELSYKYLVLQIYMKYGLTEADAISEAGDIVRGGALPRQG